MRFLFGRLIGALLALTACFCACWFFRASNAVQLSELIGQRVFYLSSSSSNTLIKNQLRPLDVFRVKGESVRFTAVNGQETAEQIIERYRASIRFCESVCGTVSYYCYSPRLQGGLTVNGVKVNLHVAVKDGDCVVGSPMIFGGF